MSTESLHPIEGQRPSTRLTEFEQFLAEYTETPVPNDADVLQHDFELRREFATCVSLFVRSQAELVNDALAAQHRGRYPMIPQDLVAHSLGRVIDLGKHAPARKTSLFEQYGAPAVISARRYPQIAETIELGRQMQQERHPLAMCATDVLIGFGLALAQLPPQRVGYRR